MDIVLRLLGMVQELALVTWLGGLIYICFVLPPMPDQDALPPVFVRMLGLQRFRRLNLACLAVLTITSGILPLVMGYHNLYMSIARLLLIAVALASSLQLQGFLNTALAGDRARPVPALCDEDPARVDKLLRQINKVSRALVFIGLAIAVLIALP